MAMSILREHGGSFFPNAFLDLDNALEKSTLIFNPGKARNIAFTGKWSVFDFGIVKIYAGMRASTSENERHGLRTHLRYSSAFTETAATQIMKTNQRAVL